MALFDRLRDYKNQVKSFIQSETQELVERFESFVEPTDPQEYNIFATEESSSSSAQQSEQVSAAIRNFRALRKIGSKAVAGLATVWTDAFRGFIGYLNEGTYFAALAAKAMLWTATAIANLTLLVSYPFTVAVVGGLTYMFGDKARAKEIVQKATANLASEINIISTLAAIVIIASLTPFISSSAFFGAMFSTVGLSVISVGALAGTIWHDQIKDRLFKPAAEVTTGNLSGLTSVPSAENQLEHEAPLISSAALSSGAPVLQTVSPSVVAANSQEVLDANMRKARFAGGVVGVFFSPAPIVAPTFAALGAAAAETALDHYRERTAPAPSVSI